MSSLRHIIIVIAVFFSIATFTGSGDVSAASCDRWFTFTSDCNATPPYCASWSDCSLSGWINVVKNIVWNNITNKPLSEYIQDVVRYFLSFISVIAVIYIIYAWFQVMIGGGDEEKVKKAKNIIIYIILGIVIMWLAYAIVKWTLDLLWKTRGTSYEWLSIPEANANSTFTESELDTFREYQNKLRIATQNIEWELKVNRIANVSSLQNLKTLLQWAYERLPDAGNAWTDNDTAKRAVDIDIDVAIKNPTSTSLVGTALSRVSAFINSASIQQITGDISASPSDGNAPLVTSFRANNIKDPSGTNPDSQNYIWWMRGNGGRRIELGRGPSLTYTFNQEWTFTVFLDVVSSSRNSKWKIDVLPLSLQKQVEVKPKLGEIILLINGVNISNMSSLKINPDIGKMGILLDASASRAVWNGTITETTWDFWNGNTISYKGWPIVERQLYSNEWTYPVKLTIKTNTDQSFTKDFQLVVRDPSAIIQLDNPVGHIGENMSFRSLSYFSTQNNIEYGWSIQNEDNKKVLKSAAWASLTYKFDTIGSYIITLTSRSPNGNIDTDSRVITIESRDPVINLNSPQSLSNEKPNTIVFDASKSYDPDTMSRKWLTFTWRLNGEKVTLDNLEQDGAKWTYKFDTVGTNTISLTIANKYGKVSTIEKTFEVKSVLSVNMVITPSVAPIWTTINFIWQSENAGYYEWNMWDGSAPINGSRKVVQHVFAKTWIYKVTLTVKSRDGSSSNQITKTVYVTDTNSPFANIVATNGSSTVFEDDTACTNGAIVVNRSESTNFDGSNSINIDGSTSGLSYTWDYFWRVKTTPYISEKFSELGCFPIKLTVRSATNGSTHTSTRYISLRNQNPELTSISATVDNAKKDAQKLLVKVTANGARDSDGVITSYIWYYTTESDKEPQNVQITQKNEITFVLPNITEKYYFWVILEDNDGGRKNSMDDGVEQNPLIIDNQNGNIYLPLITLSSPKTGLAGEELRMSVSAKTIVWTDITSKAEYSWDFDGDGKIDQKTQSASVNHIYKNSGTYSLKVRVTYNGVSNTKYQTIAIKNPLKAGFYGYKLQNWDLYLINASKGPYDRAFWNVGSETTESLYSIRIPADRLPIWTSLWKITISSGDSDTSTADIDMKDVREVTWSWVSYQSVPLAIDNTIHVTWPGEKVLISLVWNTATRYSIDEDTSIDSDLDGISDNDTDNKDSPSYTDWSVYSFQDFSTTGNRTRKVKLSLFEGNTPLYSEIITIVFDYIPENQSVSGESLISLSSENLNAFDKKELDTLAGLIRETESENRIILMQLYNALVENWDDPFSKAKSLIDLQEKVNELNIESTAREDFWKTIDALLVGDSTSTDEITIAVKLIEWLIPQASSNRNIILEKLESIKSHPKLLAENKVLGTDILKLIENDENIETKYKLHIKNQLLIIVNGGQDGIPAAETEVSTTSGWFLWLIGWIVKIFFIIIGILLFIVLIAFVAYRISRKNTNIGFQDFLIDAVFHGKRDHDNDGEKIVTQPVIEVQRQDLPIVSNSPVIPVQDPLKSFTSYTSTEESSTIASSTPSLNESIISPAIDPLSQTDTTVTQLSSNNNDPLIVNEVSVPDWLKAPQMVTPTPTIEEVNNNIPWDTTVAESDQWESIIQPIENSLTIDDNNTIQSSVDIVSEQDENQPEKSQESTEVYSPIIVQEESAEDVLLIKEDIVSTPEKTEDIWDLVSPIVTPEIEKRVWFFDTEAEIVKDDLIAPPPIAREPNMPDWLAMNPISEWSWTAVIEEDQSPTSDSLVNSEITSPWLAEWVQVSDSNTLPDWLIQSVKSNEDSTSDTQPTEWTPTWWLLDMIENSETEEKQEKKKKSWVPKKKVTQNKSEEKDTKKAIPNDNIPDWLK